MPKKTKRTTGSRTTTTVSMAPSTSSRTEFNPDYSYVKRDLTRIGTLAGLFIGILVALSFFLR